MEQILAVREASVLMHVFVGQAVGKEYGQKVSCPTFEGKDRNSACEASAMASAETETAQLWSEMIARRKVTTRQNEEDRGPMKILKIVLNSIA